MDTNNQEKEKLIGFEIMRLMTLVREHGPEELLSLAMAGREQTVTSVTRLFHFVLRTFGDTEGFTPSTVTRKYWSACSAYFAEAGLTQQEQLKIKNPHPKAGEPGFRSVLEEFEEERS